MRAPQPSLRGEAGRIGPSVILGLVGAILGAVMALFAALPLGHLACRSGDPEAIECIAGLFYALVGVPAGVLIGGVAGAIVGARRPRTPVPQADGTVPVFQGPPVHREAPMSASLGVVGGLMTTIGAFNSWRIVTFSPEVMDRYADVLTPGPESLGFLGGLIVLFAGVLRVLRPAAPAPTAIIAVGTGLATVGVVWAFIDLVGVPKELPWRLLPGYWISLVGTAMCLAATVLDPAARRRSEARQVAAP